jgi:hypothetical protein
MEIGAVGARPAGDHSLIDFAQVPIEKRVIARKAGSCSALQK